ncbi:MAG TPA: hypothetical protein VIU12_23690 [Chryseolinea sp.]
MTLRCVFTLILATGATTVALSPSKRPKVGVVLSVGGAKGMAHSDVFVLKAMEEV